MDISMQEYLNDIAAICMKELDDLDIHYGIIDSYDINTRAKKRWGQTISKSKRHYSINISERLLTGKTEFGLKDTIIHELLHTVYGSMDHGKRWQKNAKKVRERYGYPLKRTSSASDKGL